MDIVDYLFISNLLLWLLVTMVTTQEYPDPTQPTCYTCEEYLGSNCQCDRYEFYWDPNRRLYGLHNCKGLTQVPDFRPLCKTGDLWNINLSGVPLTIIPRDAFLSLYFINTVQNPNFRPTIDLSATGFEEVTQGAFEGVYTNLESLILDHNQLKSIPEEFEKITSLTYLSLKGNKLKDLPLSLTKKLKNIEILDLSDNDMKTIPKHLCNFQKLDQVDLQFNPISGDLSHYIHILVKCVNLRSLLWPRTTMRCTCETMKQYSAEYSPQFNIPAKYRLTRGSSYTDMDLLCDLNSSPTFVGRALSDIKVGEVWRTCYNETCSCCKDFLLKKTSSANTLHFIHNYTITVIGLTIILHFSLLFYL